MQLDLVRTEIKALAPPGIAPHELEALAHQLAGGLFGLLVWWMEGRPRMTALEASALFRRTARGALRAALE